MWTSTTREHDRHRATSHQSDVADAEWRLTASDLVLRQQSALRLQDFGAGPL